MATVLSQPRNLNLSAVTWQALSYVAGKESDRDALEAGAAHQVDLHVSGTVDGLPVQQAFSGRLTVGQDGTRNSAVVPNLAHLIAAVLGKLNDATRAAVLRDLPAEFAANGGSLPELSVGLVAQADSLIKALKSTRNSAVRGAVKCEYRLTSEPALAVVG
jgi:hypothetical protein